MHGKPAGDTVSRRGFLGALGAIAPGIGVCAMAGASAAQAQPASFTLREDRFGRIFRDLPPFATPGTQLTAARNELGKAGGIMDAKDPTDLRGGVRAPRRFISCGTSRGRCRPVRQSHAPCAHQCCRVATLLM